LHTLAQLKSGELAGIQRLSLSANLTSLPPEIFDLADSLEILDVSNNQLSSLPSELRQLKKLKIVFASNNRFTALPEVLGQCENIEMLGFKANQIRQVSAKALPPKLRWLTLTDNQLETLPEAIGQCHRLQKLLLAGNRLQQLPHSLAQCRNLELLRISANQLADCPEHILDLPKLAWLAFASNPFSQSEPLGLSVPEIASSSYTLDEVLGQGASGVISKAHWDTPQDQFPSDIAVKVFKGEVTSDGYPQDELRACLNVGRHPNLLTSLAQVNEADCLALIMNLIPPSYKNLGLPPSLSSCTRDTFPEDFSLSAARVDKIIQQMTSIYEHLHAQQVCHGDLYAHNTLFDDQANILFGDFGAASMYHMLSAAQQKKIQTIERRALAHFIDDLSRITA
jgi:Leucine-rich repeat (LRR) protein